MPISENNFAAIRSINIDAHRTVCAYNYWEPTFPDGHYLARHLAIVKDRLGHDFTRADMVNFYRQKDVKPETKFVAAMIWGHEAPEGSRRDSRGPWKLSKMFEDPEAAQASIRSVSVATLEDIVRSYKVLDKALNRCGPNFFTKHFYFLGKAQGLNPYPLIFDDRVANGLVKIATTEQSDLDCIRVSAARKPADYLAYLEYTQREATRIGCELDQIEYYFFNL